MWSQFQDIVLRVLIASTGTKERQFMGLLAVVIHHTMAQHSSMGKSQTDYLDRCEVLRTYNARFPLLANNEDPSTFSIYTSRIIFLFVSSMIVPTLSDYISTTSKTGIETLWAELDKEKENCMEAGQRDLVRLY